MKNISLYTLKLLLSLLFSIGFFMSCTEKDPELDIDSRPHDPNATEVLVKLLIKGESILPPNTKQMSPDVEGSFQSDLQLLILKKIGDTYHYECSRPVEGSEVEGFSVKVPNSLDGSDLKFLLFANAKSIITHPDIQFKVDEVGISETEILNKLVLEQNTQWNTNEKIPMWAEDTFSFVTPKSGSSSPLLATLKLMRMLARVDIGVNYSGTEVASTANGLNNFILKEVKVYQTGNKGFLMPKPENYIITGTGSDKKVKINKPSIPTGDKSYIPHYSIPVPANKHSCEREIYLFEQEIVNGSSDFDVRRSCILVRGCYNGQVNDGWYRLDFRNFGDDTGYKNVLRNMLYRFNITKVNGSGFVREEDALESASSNMTVQLTPMELQQNDIIFDGQSFLSVSTSEIFFYQDKKVASLSLTTNYSKGWHIDYNGLDYIKASPESGTSQSAVIEFLNNSIADTDNTDPHVFIVAGNLKKKILIKNISEDAPGDLQSFSLDPFVLYFAKPGGTGHVNVLSNIQKKYLSQTAGKLKLEIPHETTAESFSVLVKPFQDVVVQPIENGRVNVQVKAANANVTASCEIKQLTYEKDIFSAPAVMEHGVRNGSNKALLSIPYVTSESEGTYWINFTPISGLGDPLSKLSDATKSIEVTAQPNKTSKSRIVGKLTFNPALDGEVVPLIGYTPKEFMIQQAPVPSPKLKMSSGSHDLKWNQVNHSFLVDVDTLAFVENNSTEVSLTSNSGNGQIDMVVPPNGILGVPVNFVVQPNRTDNTKNGTIFARVRGWDGQSGTSEIVFTQQAPEVPREPNFGSSDPVQLNWNSTSTAFQVSELHNIYEIQVLNDQPIAGTDRLDAQYDNRFTMNAESNAAILNVNFPENHSNRVRKLKLNVRAFGNRVSSYYSNSYIIEQMGRRIGELSIPIVNNVLASGETRTISYVANEFVNASTLQATSTAPSWLSVTNVDKTDKTITFEAAVNDGGERSATIRLVGVDMENTPLSADVNITQQGAVPGTITLTPRDHRFSYSGGSGHVNITTTNIVDDLTITFDDKPEWINITRGVGNRSLDFTVEENLTPHARAYAIQVVGTDTRGQKIRDRVHVGQLRNDIRLKPQAFTLVNDPHDESGNNYTIRLENNSLPFDNCEIEVLDNMDQVKEIRASRTDDNNINIWFAPRPRHNTHHDAIIPVNVKLTRTDLIKAERVMTFTRKAIQPYCETTLDDKDFPNTQRYDVIEIKGYIKTSGLKDGDYIKVRPRKNVSHLRGSLRWDGGVSVQTNAWGNVVLYINSVDSTPVYGFVDLVATDRDGVERVLASVYIYLPINNGL